MLLTIKSQTSSLHPTQNLKNLDVLQNALAHGDCVVHLQVAEHLSLQGVYTLFATHFPKLSELAVLYPNCKLWHLDVTAATEDGSVGLRFNRKLVAGHQGVQNYGLALAPTVCLSSPPSSSRSPVCCKERVVYHMSL